MHRNLLQCVGAGLLIVIGTGHLAILAGREGSVMLNWMARGLWAAVPLGPGATPDPGAARNALVFWAGIGGFAIPSMLLGTLLWRLAARDVRPGAWLGLAVAGWFALFSTLLVPSPGILGVVAGMLLVLASREPRQTPSGHITNDGELG